MKETLENDSGRLIATLEITLNKLNEIIEQQGKRVVELEAQLEEEYSRGVKDGLNQAADIVKNC